MNPSNPQSYGRRGFLKAGTGTLASASIINTMANLRLASDASAQGGGGGYKALVCLYLSGGNDSWNMLSPRTASEHATYAASRSNLAIPSSGSDASLQISPTNTPGRTFGIHPAMPDIESLFNSGDLSFVSNVGTLVQPTSVAQYAADQVPLPTSLFSHSDQTTHWHTSQPASKVSSGWIGRTADLMQSVWNPSGPLSMNFTLTGNSLLQTGTTGSSAFAISADGSELLLGDEQGANNIFSTWNSGLRNANSANHRHILEQAYGEVTTRSYDDSLNFKSAFDNASISTNFPNTSLGMDLEAVARTIKSAGSLSQTRQTFLVTDDGWDMHARFLERHGPMLEDVSEAVSAFWNALGELGLQDDVVLFTASEFSRTLRSNGQGTDHGWGGNSFVLGGGVEGKQVLGDYPTSLSIGTGLDVGTNGRILPTTSCDEYFCELLRWFGVAPGDMATVLPNIANFHNPYSATGPLGLFT